MAQVLCGEILGKLWKNLPSFLKETPTGYIKEFFQSKFSIYSLGEESFSAGEGPEKKKRQDHSYWNMLWWKTGFDKNTINWSTQKTLLRTFMKHVVFLPQWRRGVKVLSVIQVSNIPRLHSGLKRVFRLPSDQPVKFERICVHFLRVMWEVLYLLV